MNIKDLAPGSYQVVKQGVGAPLNINNLAPGSYTVTPPAPAPAPAAPKMAPINWAHPVDALKGAVKSVASAGIGLDTGLQAAGSAILAPVTAGVDALKGKPTSLKGAYQQNQSKGLQFLNPASPTAKTVQGMLTPKNPQQATGNFLGNLAQMAIPGGSADATKAASTAGDLLTPSAEKTAAKAASDALDIVSPKNTTKAAQKAIAAGKGQVTGWLKTASLSPDEATQQAARAVQGIVSKSKTGIENANAVRDAIGKEAESLKSQIASVNHPYTFKELASSLKSIEKPVMLKSDSTLSRAYDTVVNKALDIAKSKDGTISSLLDTRKEFDSYVQKEFPNIFSDARLSPMQSAVKSIRNGLNDFIEKNLPDNVAYKDSLRKQSSMYDALDNISVKAANEIGTNAISRAGRALQAHPAAKAVEGGLALLGADKAIKGLTGFGL
jgi:hypothetical protein